MANKVTVKAELEQLIEKLNQRKDYAALREVINNTIGNSGVNCLWVCKLENQLVMSISLDSIIQKSSESFTL